MKKALSVILGMMIIIGILAVGAAAEEVEEPVFNYSYKSGDIVDLQADIYPLLQKYIKTGVRSHVNIVFNADTTEPISGAGGEWDDDTYYPAGIKGVGIPLIDSLTFSGTGAILLDMNYAFSGSNVKELYLPYNMYSFDFDACEYSISKFIVGYSGEPLVSDEGLFMFENSQELETVTVDNPSDLIFRWAFYRCPKLKIVHFTDKVTTICRSMFQNCTSLENIEIPPTISKICDCAFYNTGLKSIYIPETVTTIEPYALGYQGNNPFATDNIYWAGRFIGDCAEIIQKYPEKYNMTKVEGFKIYGVPGSEAERYANENGFEFISADEMTDENNKVYSAQVMQQANIGEYAEVSVAASAGADKIQFINSDGKTITYSRDSSKVQSIKTASENVELWKVLLKTYKETDTYSVIAKFGKTWVTGDDIQFTINELKLFESKVYSAKVESTGAVGSYAYVNVIVGGSPLKIMLQNSAGSTITYTRDSSKIESIKADNTSHTETWRIKVKIYKPTEDYTVYAKYNKCWSNETAAFTLNEAVVIPPDIALRAVDHSDYETDDSYYVTVNEGTKKLVGGNIYESDKYYTLTREDLTYEEYPGENAPTIHYPSNGKEVWELPGGFMASQMFERSGKKGYISAQTADESWIVKSYRMMEQDLGERRVYYFDQDSIKTESPNKVYSASAANQNDGTVDVKVKVGKDASKLCFVNSRGSTITYTPDNAAVKSIEKSEFTEIWTVSLKVYRQSETYTVNAKYGREWITDSGVKFTVTA